jgi:hypothetical protein
MPKPHREAGSTYMQRHGGSGVALGLVAVLLAAGYVAADDDPQGPASGAAEVSRPDDGVLATAAAAAHPPGIVWGG